METAKNLPNQRLFEVEHDYITSGEIMSCKEDTCNVKFVKSGEASESKQAKSKKQVREYKIDSSKLEESLQKQIEDDKHYWLQNDVKIRAVTQGGLSYDDFRHLVASAHLKPLSKEDQEVWKKTRSTVLWNSMADLPSDKLETLSLSSDSSITRTSAEDPHALPLPKTTVDFLKIWKTLNIASVKILYLFKLFKLTTEEDRCDDKNVKKVSCMEKLFKEEVPPQVFPEIIQLLITFVGGELAEFSPGLVEYMDCLRILQIMSNSKRFQLTMNFLSEFDRKNVNMLLTILTDVSSKPDVMLKTEDKDSTCSEFTQEKVLTLLQTVGNNYYNQVSSNCSNNT